VAEKTILRALESGETCQNAAHLAGMPASTLHLHRSKNPEFSERCLRATAKAQSEHLAVVVSASRKGDLEAAEWMLSHRWPAVFAPKVDVLLAQELGSFCKHLESVLPGDVMEAVYGVAESYASTGRNGDDAGGWPAIGPTGRMPPDPGHGANAVLTGQELVTAEVAAVFSSRPISEGE
jgi:hypothetical protein